jgi:hypothetical protein
MSADLQRWWVGLLAVVTALLAASRLASIRLSLWWDEAFTAQRYVREAPETLLDPEAYVANNHVLFSALTWATTRIIGTSEPALRVWALVPAALATALLVRWLWRRSAPEVAVLTAALTCTSTLWLAMSVQARGYGLVVLAATVTLMVVVAEDRSPTWRGDLAVAGAGLVAVATFPPTVALYLAHTGLWLLRRRAARVRLVLLTVAVGLLAAVLYRPLLPAMLERADQVGSRFADPISWWSPVVAPLQLLGGPSFGLGTDLGPVTARGATVLVGSRAAELGVGSIPGLVALVFGIVGLVVLLWRLDRPLGSHLLAGLGGAIVLLAPVGFHLADRYISFLLPHATVAIAVGLAAACGRFGGLPWAHRPKVAGWLAAGSAALLLLGAAPVVWQASTIPLQAFAAAAADAREDVRADPATSILVDRYHTGYRWYLDDLPVERITDQAELDRRMCTPQGPVVFAHHPDLPALEVPACLTGANERRYPQQRGPGHLSVWVVGLPAG